MKCLIFTSILLLFYSNTLAFTRNSKADFERRLTVNNMRQLAMLIKNLNMRKLATFQNNFENQVHPSTKVGSDLGLKPIDVNQSTNFKKLAQIETSEIQKNLAIIKKVNNRYVF